MTVKEALKALKAKPSSDYGVWFSIANALEGHPQYAKEYGIANDTATYLYHLEEGMCGML